MTITLNYDDFVKYLYNPILLIETYNNDIIKYESVWIDIQCDENLPTIYIRYNIEIEYYYITIYELRYNTDIDKFYKNNSLFSDDELFTGCVPNIINCINKVSNNLCKKTSNLLSSLVNYKIKKRVN